MGGCIGGSGCVCVWVDIWVGLCRCVGVGVGGWVGM